MFLRIIQSQLRKHVQVAPVYVRIAALDFFTIRRNDDRRWAQPRIVRHGPLSGKFS